MRVSLAGLAGLSCAVLLGLTVMPNGIAQDKAQKAADKSQKAAPANIQGIIQNMSKETSTITVRTGTGTVTRQVIYNANTKFRYGHSDDNKPGALAQVKLNNFISCVGAFDAKAQLAATECVYRETK